VLQRLVVALLDDPGVADLLEQAAATYQHRRQALITALAGHGVPAHGRSGLNVWVPVTEEAPVVTALMREGWAVRAGEAFRLGSTPAIRVTVASLDVGEAPRVADAIAGALRPATSTRSA
ncbi:MAG: aminotransferase class I/II-fold pyridoxal phosphate-dependent enzyme, partial [Actinomycetota bacterium]|nr:aminotransferase class I/II-fold pyridoxal phosphate-dependent enzyme [Actinomycetota bacterium]